MKNFTITLGLIGLLNLSVNGQTFQRITSGDIGIDATNSHSVSWGDFNNDGLPDVFVTNGGTCGSSVDQLNTLYMNMGSGQFTRMTNAILYPMINDLGNSFNATWGDYNNDGQLDLFVTCRGVDNLLYTNLGGWDTGNGRFVKETDPAKFPMVADGGSSRGSSWADYNRDGYLDLFVANTLNENNFLYKNNGDGSFMKIYSGDIVNDGGRSGSGQWGDYNNDGYPDLYVANVRNTFDFLYLNNGDCTFTKVTNNPIVDHGGFSQGGAWGDYDNDGDLDLYITTDDHTDRNRMFRNDGDGAFTRVSAGDMTNNGNNSYSGGWADMDNDGDMDMFVANCFCSSPASNGLYKNDGNGIFANVTSQLSGSGTSLGAAWADMDGDGDMDLFVANQTNQLNFLYENTTVNANSYLIVKLAATQSNRSAIGARVILRDANGAFLQMQEVSAQSGAQSQKGLDVIFGLGSGMTQGLQVEVKWLQDVQTW